jgi:hypothetical protein
LAGKFLFYFIFLEPLQSGKWSERHHVPVHINGAAN